MFDSDAFTVRLGITTVPVNDNFSGFVHSIIPVAEGTMKVLEVKVAKRAASQGLLKISVYGTA